MTENKNIIINNASKDSNNNNNNTNNQLNKQMFCNCNSYKPNIIQETNENKNNKNNLINNSESKFLVFIFIYFLKPGIHYLDCVFYN